MTSISYYYKLYFQFIPNFYSNNIFILLIYALGPGIQPIDIFIIITI